MDDQKEVLEEMIDYVMNWGKPDQIYHLTHLLLPYGNYYAFYISLKNN